MANRNTLSESEDRKMINRENWIFKNCPFQMLDTCFKKLFPNVRYEAYFQPDLKDDEGNEIYGLTTFTADGEIEILIGLQLSINDTVETFAHELAHAGVEVITKFFDGKGLTYFPKVEKDTIGKTVFLTREEAEKAIAERSDK